MTDTRAESIFEQALEVLDLHAVEGGGMRATSAVWLRGELYRTCRHALDLARRGAALQAEVVRLREALEAATESLAAVAAPDELVEAAPAAFGVPAYLRCREQAEYGLARARAALKEEA